MKKQAKYISLKTILAAFTLSLFIPLIVSAQDFTQGYSSDETLLRGSVVALNKDDTNKVETITVDREEDMLGVVVRSNDSALTLTSDRSGAFVATSGRFEVLFSDINGDVKSGDLLTISSLRGIAMRADERQKTILGTALVDSNFGDPNNVISQPSVTDEFGNPVEVAIGRILIEVDIKQNPFAESGANAPEFLVALSETVAGKPVSALRIYAGIIVLLVASAITGSLLYSAVKSSIISIGRNPLSKRSVLAGLAQVVIISLIIFMSGLFAVYLILKI